MLSLHIQLELVLKPIDTNIEYIWIIAYKFVFTKRCPWRRRRHWLGTLRNHDGDCNENVAKQKA